MMSYRYLAAFIVAVLPQVCGANDALALRDGLLVDPSSGQVMIMRPSGGIESIDADNGATIWQTDRADRPLQIEGQEVLCQVDTATPGTLDLARMTLDSGQIVRSEALGLPSNVIPLVDERMGQRFEYRAFGRNQFAWRYEKKTVSGMPLEQQPDGQISSGAFGVSPEAITASVSPAAQELSNLWQAQSPVAQNTIANVEGRQFNAVDGAHILVSSLDVDATQWDRYIWEIYTAAGEKLVTTRSHMSYSPFLVVSGQLLFVTQPYTLNNEARKPQHTPLMLKAISVATGNVTWSREIRDTRYNGPYPA